MGVGTLLGVPIIRVIVFWGLYWGNLILGNYHIRNGGLMGSFPLSWVEWQDTWCMYQDISSNQDWDCIMFHGN